MPYASISGKEAGPTNPASDIFYLGQPEARAKQSFQPGFFQPQKPAG